MEVNVLRHVLFVLFVQERALRKGTNAVFCLGSVRVLCVAKDGNEGGDTHSTDNREETEIDQGTQI